MTEQRLSADTAAGTEFEGTAKHVTFPRLWAFSGGPLALEGWPRSNLHTDPAFAKRVGMESVGASGTQYQGYVIQLLIELFGESWLENGHMKDIRFVKVVPDGAVLVPKAVVRGAVQAEGSTRVVLDVSCIDADGDPVLIGEASGVVA